MSYRLLSLVMAGLAVLLLQGCAGASAQPDVTSAPARDDGLAQALTVHGWWSIDVRNASGNTVQHTEFENALVRLSGDMALAQLLSAQSSIGDWDINIDDGVGQGNQLMFTSVHRSFSTEPILNVTVITFGPFNSDAHLQLQGSAPSPATQTLRRAFTFIGVCTPAEMPTLDGCVTQPSGQAFSSADLPQPVSVTQGQQVLVTVTFSFS